MPVPAAVTTIVCLASYFKGTEFLVECRRQGATVVLVGREKIRDEGWPWDAITEFVPVPNAAPTEVWVDAVAAVARRRSVNRVVAIEEYDVLNAALIREHFRLGGMSYSTARLFRDKLAMRVRAREAGLRVPEFVPASNEEQIRAFMGRVPPPWVLKPRLDVSAIGIQKLETEDAVWASLARLDERPALAERASYFLLEQYVAGDVFHVDALVAGGLPIFAGVNRYARPPMDVAHQGGVFVTTLVPREGPDHGALVEMNASLIAAFGLRQGATHAEFIRSAADGACYFLEVAARVGGAYIADTLEAASGINLWREWARLELAGDEASYELPPARGDYAGIALALARQEWPDTSAYADPEVVTRISRRHHVGLIVASPSHARVEHLLAGYTRRFADDFLAVLPPRQRAE